MRCRSNTVLAKIAIAFALTGCGNAWADQGMLELANARGCFVCHNLAAGDGQTAPLAPSYADIAARYKDRQDAVDYLADRIRNGTVYKEQNWAGDINMRFMPPNVNVSKDEARELSTWIVSLHGSRPAEQALRHEAMLALANTSGCMACHEVKRTANDRYVPLAPSFNDIASRYQDDTRYQAQLVDAVLHGTMNKGKSWADVNMRFMPPSVALRKEDAEALVSWILSLN